MRYWKSRILTEQREDIYKNYIADTLYYHNENKRLVKRLQDIIDPEPQAPEPTQEEILNKLKKGGIQIV